MELSVKCGAGNCLLLVKNTQNNETDCLLLVKNI